METLWLGAGVFAHPCIKKKKKILQFTRSTKPNVKKMFGSRFRLFFRAKNSINKYNLYKRC